MLDKDKLLNWLQHMYEGNQLIDMKGECVAYATVINKIKSGELDTTAKHQEVYKKYAKHVEAYCGWQKVDGQNPDEEFMRAIETNIGISNQAKKAFREEILIRISAHHRKGKVFDYTTHERLREGIQKYIESTAILNEVEAETGHQRRTYIMNTGTVPTEEIRKALDAKYWTLEQATQVPTWLRCLLEENERITKELEYTKGNLDAWTKDACDTREELKLSTQAHEHAERDLQRVQREIQSLRSELAAKDKVLEWYANGAYCYVSDDFNNEIGEKAHSILSQYAKES